MSVRTAAEIQTEIDKLSTRPLPLIVRKSHAREINANIRRMAELHAELRRAQRQEAFAQQSTPAPIPGPTREDMVGAKAIRVDGRWMPIHRLNAKSVTVLWGNPGNQERELVPFRRIEGWR